MGSLRFWLWRGGDGFLSWLCALLRALQAKLTLRLRCCTDAVDVRGFVWLRRRRRRRAAVSATDGDTPREAAVSRLVARAAAGGAPAAEMAAQTVAARSAVWSSGPCGKQSRLLGNVSAPLVSKLN